MKECIILAGGFGTRLQSVVKDVPKCMAEVAGKPFLTYILKYLEEQQFSHIILSLGYKADIILEWLNVNKFRFEISYVIEEKPLGTGGAIKYAMTKAKGEQVFVMNGDTFFAVNLTELLSFGNKKNADISLSLKPMTNFDRYGSVDIDYEERIINFNEKAFCNTGLINGGTYLINKKIFNSLSLPDKFSFEKDILENKDIGLKMYGYVEDQYFIDIGIPSDFEKANSDFKNLWQ
ncbi:D-mannose-1-phosphate guanyltransferase [Dysgonomonas sp. 216]|uniref:nucleotidyltransferase family protein n=1 Tax=Dysgonomonas sp. 216 TaxID=2302934 RepID=UPI0013D82807|nr:nucleotidyltransferase family protein [Dysgonomonas sp. 216]NDW18065.1 D-mannose-1-phosphate guanyltransferase [Dysgonomonas sp. 216]